MTSAGPWMGQAEGTSFPLPWEKRHRIEMGPGAPRAAPMDTGPLAGPSRLTLARLNALLPAQISHHWFCLEF